MFDHHVIVDEAGPARFPEAMMITEMKTLHLGVFGGDGRQPGLKAAVVISKRPDFARLAGGGLKFPETFLRGLDFLLNGRHLLPPDRRMAGHRCTVEGVTILDNGDRL